MPAWQKVAIGGGALFVLLLLFMLNQTGFQRRQPTEDIGAGGGTPGNMRRFDPLTPAPSEPPVPQRTSLPSPVPQVEATLRRSMQQRPLKASNLLAWEDGNERRGGDREEGAPASRAAGDQSEADDAFAARLRSTRTETTRARRLRDTDLTLTMGAIIPCTPEQPLNTQLPGFLSCRVPTAVYGASGRVPLLDEGTKIVGQIQRQMEHGQNRAFILWTRAETPDGVVVDLGSPGTDARGQNGVPVEVHTNFWQRFGGAVMLSFLDAGLQYAALSASNGMSVGPNGQQINLYSLQSGGRSAAATALQSSVNIPPYGTAEAGSPSAIFVARDVDFASVYRLRRTGQ